jgi:hypothetical protein
MNTEILKQYAEVKRAIKALEDQESLLKEAVMVELDKNKVDKAETAYGKFTIGVRKSYVYSPKVALLKEKVKLAELEEVEKGIAEAKETKYLVFK